MTSNSKETGWRQFLQLCLKAGNAQALDKVLRLHLTQEEQEDIATRFLIVRELLKGKMSQREMSQELHVSIAKITRGSNSMKLIDEDLRKLLCSK